MIVTKNTTTILLAGCIAILVVASSGCCSGGFGKPDFAALKFWKAPEDATAIASKTPPPPARYFDPAPILEEQIAKKNADETINLNGQRLSNALASNTSSLANTVGTNVRNLNDVLKTEKGVTPLAATQNDFNAAVKNAGSATKNAGSATKNTASTTKTANSAQAKWNDFKLPADLKSPIAKPNLNQSLAGLNKSIYDANGKRVNSSQEVKQSILNKLDPNRNSFPVANKVSDAKLNQFAATAKSKAAAVTKANEFDFSKAPSLPKSAPLATTFTAPTKKPQPATFAATAKPAASSAELKLVQAQVADANRQIELLKRQIAQSANQPKAPPIATHSPLNTAKIPVPSNSFVAAQPAPVQRVGQLKTPRFGNSKYSAINSNPENSFAGTSSTNILRASQKPGATQAAPRTALPSSNVQSPFPSTPHGNFAPQGKFGSFVPNSSLDQAGRTGLIPQPAAPVNFQTRADNSATLKASTAYGNVGPAAVQQIKSHLSGVDIPASILKGSGSYAPGSVHQVGR